MDKTDRSAVPEGAAGTPVRFSRFVLHVFALSGLVLAQPVYSWMSAQPQFLVAHGVSGVEVLWIVGLLSVVFPLLLVGLLLPGRLLGRRVFFCLQVFLIALLVGLFGRYAISLPGVWSVLVFGGFALAGGLLYWRLGLFRQVLSWLAVLALALPMYFVITDPVRGLVLSADKAALEAGGIESFPDEDSKPDELVVLVVLDELSLPTLLDEQGRIDRTAFPNFARLAEQSTWYPNAATVHVGTAVSMSSLATGQEPRGDLYQQVTWQHHPDNLFVWLPSVYGHNIEVDEHITHLCPDGICPRNRLAGMIMLTLDIGVLAAHAVVPRPRDRASLPPVDENWADFLGVGPGMALVDTYPLGALRSLIKGELDLDRAAPWPGFLETLGGMESGFYFKHFILPHNPYEYLYDGSVYERVLAQNSYGMTGGDRAHNVLEFQRHLMQVRYTDRLLGELLDTLHDKELWEQTLLVVLTDHGRSFRQGNHWRILDENNLAEVLNIALFIKYPGQHEGRVDEYAASMIDIAPTVGDVLNRSPGWRIDGVSLADPERPDREAYPVSCLGFVGCDEYYREQTEPSRLFLLDRNEFGRSRREALHWKQTHVEFSTAVGMHVPRVPETRLLGSPVTDYHLKDSDTGRVKLFDVEGLAEVSLEEGRLPALAGGYVEGVNLREHESLLVALNGNLAGVGVVVERGGRQLLGTLLPSGLFVEGKNDLRVFRVEWENGDPAGLSELVVVPAD